MLERARGRNCGPRSCLFLTDCTLWKGPMLEQVLKNGSPWEGPRLELFVKACTPWEGPHAGAGEEREEEGAAKMKC